MFKIIKKDKENIIFEASGTVTAKDYEKLIPAIDQAAEKYGHANLLAVVKKLEGATSGGVKQDLKFGVGSYQKVNKFALVSDQDSLRTATHIMAPFTRTKEKVFNADEQDLAEVWLKT